MHGLFRLVLSLAVFILLGANSPVHAADRPVAGGPGGGSFRDECPPDSFLVGFALRTGAFVDAIAPLCAPYLPKGVMGDRQQSKQGLHGGGGGGGSQQGFCPNNH